LRWEVRDCSVSVACAPLNEHVVAGESLQRSRPISEPLNSEQTASLAVEVARAGGEFGGR